MALQRAAKVRSLKGLLVHVFGKIAAAFMTLIVEPVIKLLIHMTHVEIGYCYC